MQQAVVVVGVRLHVHAQVACRNLFRHVGGVLGLATQLQQQAARNEAAHHQQRQAHDDDAPTQVQDLLFDDGVHVVHIHARAHDPAPRCKAFHKRHLGLRCVAAGFGPVVIDGALAMRFHHADKLGEDVQTLAVLECVQVGAVQLGVGCVHDHDGVHVIHPEVLGTAVAQGLDSRQRALFAFGLGDCALGDQLVVVGNQRVGHFNGLLHRTLAFTADDVGFFQQHAGGHDHQANKGRTGEQPQAARHGHCIQERHGCLQRSKGL